MILLDENRNDDDDDADKIDDVDGDFLMMPNRI